ncbi:very short patch repair endonuclease [Nocardia brasiliensis]|uniref:very short patch repair endonuclease n=1 Tax=Nocardia brasiliensis TaxID=37326 RepID=UPI0037A8A4EB
MKNGGKHWNTETPSELAYKRQKGAAAPAAEQDQAAGGRNRRMVAIPERKFARASISLRLYRRTRRIRAYLRWSEDGVTKERYVCEVNQGTRRANLSAAWRCAWEMGLLTEPALPVTSSASSLNVRASMRANRSKNTKPELALRRLLYQQALRYRVDFRPLPELKRRADVVFPGIRVAIFVDGCFWHGCSEHYRPSAKNAQFWRDKIEANRARDLDTNKRLMNAGWTVVRVWEHEDVVESAERIIELLNQLRKKNG